MGVILFAGKTPAHRCDRLRTQGGVFVAAHGSRGAAGRSGRVGVGILHIGRPMWELRRPPRPITACHRENYAISAEGMLRGGIRHNWEEIRDRTLKTQTARRPARPATSIESDVDTNAPVWAPTRSPYFQRTHYIERPSRRYTLDMEISRRSQNADSGISHRRSPLIWSRKYSLNAGYSSRPTVRARCRPSALPGGGEG